MRRIVVIDPCGAAQRALLDRNLAALAAAGFEIDARLYARRAGHRFDPDGVAARRALVESALADAEPAIVLCARGGYGGSDLLDGLDWARLERAAPKLLAGCSDAGALQCAAWTRLGWPSLHGPMPGSTLWRPGGADVASLLDAFRRWPGAVRGSIAVTPVGACPEAAGTLFGGCFTVLGDLVGTPDFPPSLQGAILFVEDVNESAPRLLRAWNQWRRMGLDRGLAALVLGGFTHRDDAEADALERLPGWLAQRSACPVFRSADFGHLAPNFPLMLGAAARVEDGALRWFHAPRAA